MPVYSYKARDSAGKLVRGSMQADSKEDLADKLRKMGYMVSRVEEALPSVRVEAVARLLNRIDTEDMIMFTVQLSNMINAGVSILASISTLARQTENNYLKETLNSVARNVEAGESFSEALAKHPRVFSRLFVSMVKAGISLPLPTLILFHAGTAIKHYWYAPPLFLAALWMAVKTYSKTEAGRFNCDRIKLNIPVYGALYRKVSVSRFARTLGMLLAGGVPILTSLDIIREVMSNEVLARVIDNVRNAVERGEKISESLKISQEFPADTIQMISVGEETGNLDEMLAKVSDFYDFAVSYAVKKLISLIEPLFLCILGGIVGLIMASMLLPIFDMMQILRGARHN